MAIIGPGHLVARRTGEPADLSGRDLRRKDGLLKTQYYTAASLDGFIATEDDSLDWLFPLGAVNDTGYPDFIAGVGALAMGSATYEWMLRHADKVAAETGSPWPYTQPAWVFSSRSLPALPGAGLSFVQGDVRPVHVAMRVAAGDRNIWIVGGGDLAGQFHDAGLLDEVIVQLGSVTLGKGKPLFPRRLTSPPLALVSVRQVGTGFAELRYQVPRGGRG
jgi:dihydrofolate reductase